MNDAGKNEEQQPECNYCERSELAYEMKSGKGMVTRCIPCLALEQAQQQLTSPFEEFIDNTKHEDSPIWDDAEDWEKHRRLSYESVQDWLTVMARIQDDDPLVKRDPDEIGTLNEHTRKFLTNIMGADAHHPPSEVVGSEVDVIQAKLGDHDG